MTAATYAAGSRDTPKLLQPPPFRDRAGAQAALTAWLTDGAAILLRCRVGRERTYLLDTLTEFAAMTLAELDEYWGIERWEDSDDTREWAAGVIGQAEARLRGRA